MKKLIICLLLVTICGTAYGVFRLSGSWHETECDICGKTVYKWWEDSNTFGMPMVDMGGGFGCWEGEPVSEIGMGIYLDVCSDCKDKHRKEFESLLRSIKKDWLGQKHLEYQEIRKQNQENHRLQRIEKKREEIRELEEQINSLTP